MNEQQFQSVLEPSYQIESIEPVAAPAGADGHWYRYVIMQGGNVNNAITGIRCGNLADIRVQLAEMVERLNERSGKLLAKKKTR